MDKSLPPPPKGAGEVLGRARQPAEKMARVLNGEDVTDVTIAVALLTSGVIHQYADNPVSASELTSSIRRLEDRFITKSPGSGEAGVH